MRSGRLSFSLPRGVLSGAVALLLVAWLAAAPVAGASASRVLPRIDTLQLGPLRVGAGFELYVTGQDCGSSDPTFEITYVDGGPTDRLSHTYTSSAGSCAIQPRPAAAKLRLDIPGAVDVDVSFSRVATPLRRPGLPAGCGPPFGPELPAHGTGRIDVAIHRRVFGRVSMARAPAQIFSGAPQACPAAEPAGGLELTAAIGPYILDAEQPTRGAPQLDIVDGFGDDPAPGLDGVLGLHMSGGSALSVDARSGAVRLGASSSTTAGSLSFTPLRPCAGASAQSGTLSGTLTIKDPLLGPQRIVGSSADSAYSGVGAAMQGACDGPGSQPVEPDLTSTCDKADAGCSVAAGGTTGATVTFFDESSPGTQIITAETLGFGDGSAPTPISPGGSLKHAYRTPGTYTATLTLTDAAGEVANADTSVVIDP